MPLEYQTYLLATDLRTPEDVLAWLRAEYLDRYHDAHEAAEELAYRLDRERRQACRRGALSRFEMFAWYARLVRADKDWELDNPELASEMAWDDAAACIAFRAAARQP